jgi:hypothetical protein
MTPLAKPAIFRPPRSIAAAVPRIECVELQVMDIKIMRSAARGALATPGLPSDRAEARITILSIPYNPIATGARLPRNSRSEMKPDPMDPTKAEIGSSAPVMITRDEAAMSNPHSRSK